MILHSKIVCKSWSKHFESQNTNWKGVAYKEQNVVSLKLIVTRYRRLSVWVHVYVLEYTYYNLYLQSQACLWLVSRSIDLTSD